MKHPEYEEFGFEWVDEMYPTNEEEETMKCTECCYYWQDEDESRPRCHWEVRCPGDMAPCDYETMKTLMTSEDWDDEPDDIDDDSHYDPYTGSDDTYSYMNDIDLDDWGDY